MPSTLCISSHSPEETQEIGRSIGAQARQGDIFLLTGPLGAGKTCLTQGIAWGLGVVGYTRSPTFVLIARYHGRVSLYHLDLYRINDPLEAWNLGLDEQLFGDGVCVVEWADRASEVFPEHSLWIALDYARPIGATYAMALQAEGTPSHSKRTITILEAPLRYDPLLEKLASAFAVVKTKHDPGH